MTGREVIRALLRRGWRVVRIRGSHHLLEKAGQQAGVTVPVHGKKDLGIGLVKAIEKQTGEKLR